VTNDFRFIDPIKHNIYKGRVLVLFMFNWFKRKKHDLLEDEIKRSFSGVKKDMDSVGKWIKHLNAQDKQLFELINDAKQEIATVKDDLDGFKEAFEMSQQGVENKQVFEKLPVWSKQTAVEDVQEAVQTPVQTANYNDILKNLKILRKKSVSYATSDNFKVNNFDKIMLINLFKI